MFWAAIVQATPMANATALVIWRANRLRSSALICRINTVRNVSVVETKSPANHRHGT
jgi:hypothetical protein